MMKRLYYAVFKLNWITFLTGIGIVTVLYSCNNSAASPQMAQQAMALPVLAVPTTSATTFKEYPAALEGSWD